MPLIETDFIVYQFGEVLIPRYNKDTRGNVPFVERDVRLAGGGYYDALGTERSFVRVPYNLNITGTLVPDDPTTLRTGVDALLAEAGKRGRLWRRRNDGRHEWVWARFNGHDVSLQAGQMSTRPVTMRYKILKPVWNGDAHGGGINDDGSGVGSDITMFGPALWFPVSEAEAINAGVTNVVVNNAGNGVVRDVIVTITAGNADITSVNVKKSGAIDWTFAGTITSTEALVVNAGESTVQDDGVNAYDDFTLNAQHVIIPFVELEPGDNAFDVTLVGGGTGSTILFSYYDAWL